MHKDMSKLSGDDINKILNLFEGSDDQECSPIDEKELWDEDLLYTPFQDSSDEEFKFFFSIWPKNEHPNNIFSPKMLLFYNFTIYSVVLQGLLCFLLNLDIMIDRQSCNSNRQHLLSRM